MSCCKRTNLGELPGGLVVRILGFYCHDPGSIPGGGKFLQAVWFDQKKKKKKNPLIWDSSGGPMLANSLQTPQLPVGSFPALSHIFITYLVPEGL